MYGKLIVSHFRCQNDIVAMDLEKHSEIAMDEIVPPQVWLKLYSWEANIIRQS